MIQLNDNQKIALQTEKDKLVQFAERITGKPCSVEIRVENTELLEAKGISQFIVKIKELTAKDCNVDVLDLSRKTRKRPIVEARHIAMFLIDRHTDVALAKIGLEFGSRDHSTVIHACKTVEDLMETDKDFKKRVGRINWLILLMPIENNKWIKINKTVI